jgi:hypothetical protein
MVQYQDRMAIRYSAKKAWLYVTVPRLYGYMVLRCYGYLSTKVKCLYGTAPRWNIVQHKCEMAIWYCTELEWLHGTAPR